MCHIEHVHASLGEHDEHASLPILNSDPDGVACTADEGW